MGLYNSLDITIPCEKCNESYPRELQFKYGSCQLISYQLGDEIAWGKGNDKGERIAGLCAIEAYDGEPCPYCHHTNEISLIYILDGLIIGVGNAIVGDNAYAVHPIKSLSLNEIKVRLKGIFPTQSDPVGELLAERRQEAQREQEV